MLDVIITGGRQFWEVIVIKIFQPPFFRRPRRFVILFFWLCDIIVNEFVVAKTPKLDGHTAIDLSTISVDLLWKARFLVCLSSRNFFGLVGLTFVDVFRMDLKQLKSLTNNLHLVLLRRFSDCQL